MNKQLIKFLAVRFFSAFGDQILLFAVPLLVYQATKSMALSGLAFFIEWMPRILSLPIAGILSDKFGGRKVYLFADCIRAIVCLAGFVLIYLFPNHIFYIVSILMGICAFHYAQAFIAQEATIPTLTTHAEMHKAQSMVQTIEQTTMILGPFVASILSYFLPITDLLIVAAALFAFGSTGMLLLKNFSTNQNHLNAKRHILKDMSIGAKIISNNKKLIWLCVLTVVVNLIWGLALATGAPIVTGLFSKSAVDFGFLQTSVGIFSILTLLIVPFIIQRTSTQFIGLLSYGLIIFGGLAISLSVNYWQFIVGYLLILTMDGVFNIYIRTERAKIIPREHLGKTIGLIVLINQLSIPLSGLLVAKFSMTLGVRSLYLIVSLLAALLLIWQLYQVYSKMPSVEMASEI